MATVQTEIGPADNGRRMTLDEFREADETPGHRYELARGCLEVTQVPNDPHRQVLDNLRDAISLYRHAHPGLILCLGGGAEFQLEIPGLGSERHPDLGIVFVGTPRDHRGRRQPAWVAEVVSPDKEARDRDYVAKRQEYLRFGIREYWIVDPSLRRLTVLVRDEAADGPTWRERIFLGDDPIESDLLPGFQGTVETLWKDADAEEDDPE